MDEIVFAAMKKWPRVPACYGWLALDARGDWYMRDDAAQAAGPFPQVKGSRVVNDKLRGFIDRNYAADAQGAWYFQNGPQRVYVQLEAAPFVLGVQRLDGEVVVHTHTGLAAGPVQASWVDEEGRLFLACEAAFGVAFGLMRSMDMDLAADLVGAGVWRPQPVSFDTLPGRYGYQLDPRPLP